MIVIDASALTKFIMKEDGYKEIAEYLKAGTISVDHILKEVTNAIWKRYRQGTITPKEAEIMLKALKEILGRAVKLEEELTYIDETTKIAFNQNITIYDSLYIAVAKKKGLKLLTADETQAEAAKSENVTTILLK